MRPNKTRARYGTGDFLKLHCRISVTGNISTSNAPIILKVPWNILLSQRTLLRNGCYDCRYVFNLPKWQQKVML